MWKELRTLKAKEEYFKTILNKGLCSSLKNERLEDFNDCMEAFKLHPDNTKLEGVIDICIISNKRNMLYYEFNLIKEDGSINDISYRECFKKRTREQEIAFNLNSALRVAIEPQINNFKKNIKNWKCDLCNSNIDIQIDHITLFKDLSKDFLKNEIMSIPNTYEKDYYNRPTFKEEDNDFESRWCEYHRKNAKLRTLCKDCNLTRKKNGNIQEKKIRNLFINDD
jgi:hypothetical protein